jgi:hypothetical protein
MAALILRELPGVLKMGLIAAAPMNGVEASQNA